MKGNKGFATTELLPIIGVAALWASIHITAIANTTKRIKEAGSRSAIFDVRKWNGYEIAAYGLDAVIVAGFGISELTKKSRHEKRRQRYLAQLPEYERRTHELNEGLRNHLRPLLTNILTEYPTEMDGLECKPWTLRIRGDKPDYYLEFPSNAFNCNDYPVQISSVVVGIMSNYDIGKSQDIKKRVHLFYEIQRRTGINLEKAVAEFYGDPARIQKSNLYENQF